MGRLLTGTQGSIMDFGDTTQIDAIQNMTLNLWLQNAATNVTDGFMGKGVNNNVAIDAFVQNSGEIFNAIDVNQTVRGRFDYSGPTTVNEWFMYTLRFDGTLSGNSNRLKSYLDAVLQTQTYDGTIEDTTGDGGTSFVLGNVPRSPTVPFAGKQAFGTLWTVTLTEIEITAMFRGVSPTIIRPESQVIDAPLWGNQDPEPNYASTSFTGATSDTTKTDSPAVELPENHY